MKTLIAVVLLLVPAVVAQHAALLRSAEKGNAGDQTMLGGMYAFGNGVTQDYAEAIRWYRKAADQGYVSAMITLGVIYATGRGVPRDPVEAHAWFNIAKSRSTYTERKHKNWDYARDGLDRAARLMVPAQILQAQSRAKEWKPSGEKISRSVRDRNLARLLDEEGPPSLGVPI